MYTILCAPRAPRVTAKTRMKDWWRSIGHPIEMVSGADFVTIIKANNAGDPTLGALGSILSWLHGEFGCKPFNAHDIAKKLRIDPAAVFGTNDEQDAAQAEIDARREALEELAGLKISLGDPGRRPQGRSSALFWTVHARLAVRP